MTGPDLSPLRDEFARAIKDGDAAPPSAPAVAPPPVAPVEGEPEVSRPKPKSKKRPKSDREVDADSIKGCFKRAGEANAERLGRALGWTPEEVRDLLRPPPPPAPAPAAGGTGSPPPGAPPPGGGDEPFWKPAREPVKALPADCPVNPLGRSGSTFYYLDPLNQLRDLTESDHSAGGLRALFGQRIDFLWKNWPKFNESKGNQSGWKADQASESLMHACSARGLFDAYGKVRGLGAWKDDDGALVMHHGDGVTIGGEEHPPGEHGRYIYPAFASGPVAEARDTGFEDLFIEFMTQLDSWNWFEAGDANRPKPRIEGRRWQSYLLFGWIGTAICGGALRYRPLIWVTGDAGSGKSAFLDLVADVVGDLVKSANATQAAIWSILGPSTRAVLVDEAENDPASPRTQRLVELARQAYSGDMVLRGSSDHKGHTFQARSSFMFSSIIIPPLLGQDISRFAILDMAPIAGGKGLRLDRARNEAIGRAMRRRIIDQWPTWEERLESWRGTLIEAGHNARGADVFGHLLAMADLMLYDGLRGPEKRREICALFPADTQQKTSNAEDMLSLLLSIPLDVFRGGTRMTIADLVQTATMDPNLPVTEHLPESCEKALRPWGVYLTRELGGAWRVALPNRHEGLRRLFENSQWRTAAGATGGWAQAMKRLPEARDENSRKIGGRGWSVPLKVFLMKDE